VSQRGEENSNSNKEASSLKGWVEESSISKCKGIFPKKRSRGQGKTLRGRKFTRSGAGSQSRGGGEQE
jgi:hypothetical protein